MAWEVEVKAHVDDPLTLQNRIESLHGISDRVCEEKDDIYYSVPGEKALFRMRKEVAGPSFEHGKGIVIFTRKHKAIEEGIELNQEIEFAAELSQFESAHAFFLSLGYEEYVRKTKRGYSYEYNCEPELVPLHIELVHVASLGWFLEMEFVLPSKEQIPLARNLLRSVLKDLGVSDTAIEDRYYMDLLKHQGFDT